MLLLFPFCFRLPNEFNRYLFLFRSSASNGFRSSYYGPYASSNSNNYMLADRSIPATAADDDQYRFVNWT